MADTSFQAGKALTLEPAAGRAAVPVVTRTVDKMVFALFLVLAALPYGQIRSFYLGPAVVNAHELLQLLLLCVLGFRALFVARSARIWPALLIFLVAGFFLVDTLLFREHRTNYLIVQMRAFLPYLSAAILLWTGTTLSAQRVLFGLSLAGMISAAAALVVHYFFPGFLAQVFFDSQFFVAFNQIGRLWWPNVSLAFVAVILIVDRLLKRQRPTWLMAAAALVTTAGLINTLNRTMLLGMLLFLTLVLYRVRRQVGIGRLIAVVAVVVVAFIVAISVAGLVNPRFLETAELRLLGSSTGIDLSRLYRQDFRLERVPLYLQYFSVPWTTILLGRGLGVAFASGLGLTFITTDVSFLSFLLPFGVAGLFAFLVFLVSLWRAIPPPPPGVKADLGSILQMWLIASLFISLNVDVFFRSNLVLFLTLLVVAHRAERVLESTTLVPGKSQVDSPAGRSAAHAGDARIHPGRV